MTRPRDRSLGLVLLAAVVARVAAALYFGDGVQEMPGVADQRSYHVLASRVLAGHGFTFPIGWWPATAAGAPTAHWSYLYVLLVTGIYQVVGLHPIAVRLLQAVFAGVLQPYLTWRIADRLFGPRAALAAAAGAAAYGYFVYYAGALMTESFYIVAMLWSIDIALRLGHGQSGATDGSGGTWVWLGVALAATVLLRQAGLLCVPPLLAWIAWRCTVPAPTAPRPVSWTRMASGAGAALAVLALAILPWTIRNYRAFGVPVLLNTNAGFAFFWGNHPIHGYRFHPLLDGNQYGGLIPAPLRTLNEGALDRALLSRGLSFAAEDPWRYMSLTGGRLVEYLKFWPTPESGAVSNLVRVLSFGLALPFFAAGIAAALRARTAAIAGDADRRAGAWLLILIAATHSAVYVTTWALVRYRLPVDAMLMPFAGLAAALLADRLAAAPAAARSAARVA